MMKKLFAVLLTGTMLFGLAACGATENVNAGVDTPTPIPTITKAVELSETPEVPVAKVVSPLPVTIDMNHLDNCTVAISFEKGDAFMNDSGVMQLKFKAYTYDLYDMVDIALLAEGDTIILRGKEVLVTSLVRTESGAVQINGGLDAGGYELITDESTVYFETGYSNVKTYYELGEAVLPVSAEFIFTDKMDLDKGAVTYTAEDLLKETTDFYFSFAPHNTKVVIDGGAVTQMERIYTP